MNTMTASAALASGRVRLANVRQMALVTAKTRALWVLAMFVFITFIAIIRIGQLGVSQGAPERTSMADALLPSRGEITDRRGTSAVGKAKLLEHAISPATGGSKNYIQQPMPRRGADHCPTKTEPLR